MNLKLIKDFDLIQKTETLVREERELLTSILHHLKEIERRRLFCGFGSLFEFAVKKLKYSEDQACRRISAMRLLKELPELETQITEGALSLTHLNLARTFFRREEKAFSKEEKLHVINKISGQPVRQVEKITLALSSNPKVLKADKITLLTNTQVEIRFLAPAVLEEKLSRLKGLLAHSNPGISNGELLDRLCDLGLKEWSKQSSLKRRHIFARAKNQCEICSSTFALEVDHILPRAKGGSDHITNLRLLCRSCNQRAAIEKFGLSKMEPHLSPAAARG